MEPKRLELMTVGPPPEEKKTKKRIPTFRFNLTLTESTDKICPEFSYTELVKNALGAEEDDDLDPLDPFASDDRNDEDKLKAIAKQFEEKYGNGIKPSGKKRKIKDHVSDLVDLGEGYDLEDPFIDNTEAYDEIVPGNMTTKLGGFYINSGTLDFKLCSDSDDDFQPSKAKRKKRQITSDSDSEAGEKKKKKKKLIDGEKKKKKKNLSTDSEGGNKLMKKKKLVSSEKIKMNKLKKKNPVLYWKMFLEQRQREAAGQAACTEPLVNGENETPASTEPATSAAGSGDQSDVIVIDDKSPVRANTPVSQQQATASGANTQDAAAASEAITNTNKAGSSTSVQVETSNQDSAASASQLPQKPKLETIPSLPDTLSLKLLSLVEKLKTAAKDSEAGKTKFFSPEVNDMLLVIEKDAKQLSQSERSVIYSHLAGYLPCSKDTLVKRAKKLVLDQQDDKLKEPKSKLKEAITVAMPSLLEKHQAECAAAEQLKQERSQTDNKKEGGGSTESDEDNSKDGPEKQKRIVAPRKKFEWNPYIRQLLCTVVVIKMEHYETSKVRSQSPEEYLKAFLDAEIRSLWPQGWMQTRMLFKESRSVHCKWTNQQLKPKKPIVPTKNTTPASSPALANSLPKTNVQSAASNSNTSISNKSVNNTPVSAIKSDMKSKLLSISPSVFSSPDLPHAGANKVGAKKEDVSQSLAAKKEPTVTLVTKKDSVGTLLTKKDSAATLLTKKETSPTLLDYADKNYNGLDLSSAKTQQPAKIPNVSSGLLLLNQNIHTSKVSKPSGTGGASQATKELLKHLVTGGSGNVASTAAGISNHASSQSKPRSMPTTPITPTTTGNAALTKASILASASPAENDFLKKYMDFTSSLNMSLMSSNFQKAVQEINKASTAPQGLVQSSNQTTAKVNKPVSTKSTTATNSSQSVHQRSQGYNSSSNNSKLHLAAMDVSKINSSINSTTSAGKPVNVSLNSSQVLAAKHAASSYPTAMVGKTTVKHQDYPSHSSVTQTASSSSSAKTPGGTSIQGKKFVIKTLPIQTATNITDSTKKKAVVAPIKVNPLLEQIAKEQSEMRKVQMSGTKLALSKPDPAAKFCVVTTTTNSDGSKQIHIQKQLVSPSHFQKTSQDNRLSSTTSTTSNATSQKSVKVHKSLTNHQVSPHHQSQSKELSKHNSTGSSKSSAQTFGGVSLQQIHMQMVQKNTPPLSSPNKNSESASPSAWSPSRYSSSGGNMFTAPSSVPSRTSPGYHSGLAQSGNLHAHPTINTSPDRYPQGSPYGQQSSGHRSPHGSPIQSTPQGLYPGMVGSPSPTRHPALGGQYLGFRYPNRDQSPQQYRY